MSMLDIHNSIRQSSNVCAHKIKVEYKRNENKLYIVCEGSEDLGYYGQVIKREFPGLQLKKLFAGGKNKVLDVYNSFDWNFFEKNKILFFIDRDFSYWLHEPQYIDQNVYITDEYSFENDAVNEQMFMEVLEDLYGFANASESELNQMRAFYFERWETFYENSTYVMAALFLSNSINHDHLAKNLEINKMLKIDTDKVWVQEVRGCAVKDYLYEKLCIPDGRENEIIQMIEIFNNDKAHYFVRGKWALCFMVKMLEYIIDHAKEFAPSLYVGGMREPKRLCQLTQGGTMAILAPRILPVDSLNIFLRKNINYA